MMKPGDEFNIGNDALIQGLEGKLADIILVENDNKYPLRVRIIKPGYNVTQVKVVSPNTKE